MLQLKLSIKISLLVISFQSFFISGSARIDLIAKVMDLDDDIGQYQFDIALFEKTEKAIADIGASAGMKVTHFSEPASQLICIAVFLSIFVSLRNKRLMSNIGSAVFGKLALLAFPYSSTARPKLHKFLLRKFNKHIQMRVTIIR